MFQSRLPEIAAELGARIRIIEEKTAGLVEAGAKDRVEVDTGRLKGQIHVEHDEETGGFLVLAGDARSKDFAFYGHIVEHGGVDTPARPFLMPAAEAVRGQIIGLGVEELRDL